MKLGKHEPASDWQISKGTSLSDALLSAAKSLVFDNVVIYVPLIGITVSECWKSVTRLCAYCLTRYRRLPTICPLPPFYFELFHPDKPNFIPSLCLSVYSRLHTVSPVQMPSSPTAISSSCLYYLVHIVMGRLECPPFCYRPPFILANPSYQQTKLDPIPRFTSKTDDTTISLPDRFLHCSYTYTRDNRWLVCII